MQSYYLLAHKPSRKRIRIDVDIEDSQSTRCDQPGGSEGMKESKPEINDILGELLRKIRALKEEVSRTYGDTTSVVTTICGDTPSAVAIGVGRNRGSGQCSLCCPRVHDRFLHELPRS